MSSGKNGQGKAEPEPAVRAIVHLDVDAVCLWAKGKAAAVGELVRRSAWGTRAGDGKGWALGADKLSANCPSEGLVSYESHLETLYGKDGSGRAEAEKAFLAKGGSGAKLASEAEKLRKALAVPKLIQELMKNADSAPPSPPFPLTKQFAEDLVNLFPAVFKLIVGLRKAKREFGLVFWTRSGDAQLLAEELNLFFSGEHPCYNGKGGMPLFKMDSGKGGRCFALSAENMFEMRVSEEAENTHFSFVSGRATKFVGHAQIAVCVEEHLKRVRLRERLLSGEGAGS